ncbi:hypothetical protein QAD02_023707 [Eretmocerus hayati]|uniref:Uncharacterized protein n=1 Tax=Eretmocerus hayati TaxID=131215 RepID=A0ACC2PZZ9_9HYME|nr:hypothetical protein QAD02_023707 [Eretmocerus hayati]
MGKYEHFGKFLSHQIIAQAIYSILCADEKYLEYQSDLDLFRKTKIGGSKLIDKPPDESTDEPFWAQVVLHVLGKESIHRRTLKKYSVSCYYKFIVRQQYEKIKRCYNDLLKHDLGHGNRTPKSDDAEVEGPSKSNFERSLQFNTLSELMLQEPADDEENETSDFDLHLSDEEDWIVTNPEVDATEEQNSQLLSKVANHLSSNDVYNEVVSPGLAGDILDRVQSTSVVISDFPESSLLDGPL